MNTFTKRMVNANTITKTPESIHSLSVAMTMFVFLITVTWAFNIFRVLDIKLISLFTRVMSSVEVMLLYQIQMFAKHLSLSIRICVVCLWSYLSGVYLSEISRDSFVGAIWSVTRAVSDEYCQANITKSKTIGGVSFTGVARRKST